MEKLCILVLLWLFLPLGVLADETPEPTPHIITIKHKGPTKGPRSLVDVVAIGYRSDRKIEVCFTEPLGDVTLTLSDTTGVVDFVVTDTADGPVSMLLPLEAVGEITITITDAAGSQYIGVFTYNY